jgi:chromosome segregation ATPase
MTKRSNPVRRTLGQAVRNSGPLREIRTQLDKRQQSVEDRMTVIEKRVGGQLDRFAKRADNFRALADKQAKQISQLTTRLAGLQERVRPIEHANGLRELDHGRLTTQVGAMEERLGRVEQLLSDRPLVADDAATAESRALVEEIRREHEQVRVRMQIITSYEERLRRVEASVTTIFDGDPRHPV